MTTTADSLTIDQISAVKTEAAAAGDMLMVQTCDEAFDGFDAARAVVAKAIVDAEAQNDPPRTDRHPEPKPAPSAISYVGFVGRAAREHLGERASVILDPEERSVRIDTQIGNGCPVHVWRHRAVSFSLPASVSLEAVEAVLREREDTIETIFAAYEGKRWNDSNLVGVWKLDNDANCDEHRWIDVLKEACSQVARYWTANEWFSPSTHAIAEAVAVLVRLGARPADAIEEVAKREVKAALEHSEPALLEEEDVESEVARFYGISVEKMITDRADLWVGDFDSDDVDSIVAWVGSEYQYIDVAMAALCLDDKAVQTAAECVDP